MNRLATLCAVALIVSIPLLLAWSPSRQDAAPGGDEFPQTATWNFAVLQYRTLQGETVEVPASNVSRLWLLAMGDGRLRLEILFENQDYSSIDLHNFSLIRRSGTYTAVDVPVTRARLEGMQFPSFK